MSDTVIPDGVPNNFLPTSEDRMKMLQEMLTNYAPHFSSVQIVACYSEPGDNGTQHYVLGSGSIFERIGVCQSWINTVSNLQDDTVVSDDDEPEYV